MTGLERVISALRRPGDEAQWTQIIAAVASEDARFASRVVSALVAASPNAAAAAALGEIPSELQCLAEETVYGIDGRDLGRVDLTFRDSSGTFCLLAELKLHSDYGHDQLERYVAALDAQRAQRKALIAVTKIQPLMGEDAVAGRPGWLGSVRWASVYEQIRELTIDDWGAREGWRSTLAVLRRDGDFGPMDFDAEAVFAWARRDEAEGLLRYFLGELAQPTLGLAREIVGASGADQDAAAMLMRGQSKTQPIVPWRNNMHIDYAVPASVAEPRLRVQFFAFEGKPFFSVEARYEHPKEPIGIEAVRVATTHLRAKGLDDGNDGYGHYWARVFPTDDWLAGADTLERLVELTAETVKKLGTSGIFAALLALTPSTPVTAPRPEAEAI